MLLKDLFEFLPKSKRSASYGKEIGRYPFFTSSNTIDKFIDENDYEGTYLIIGDGGTGNCKYYDGKFSISDHNYLLSPKKNTNALCVLYFLKRNNFKILNDGFKGVGIKNVSKTYIQNIDYNFNRAFTENEIINNLSDIENAINLEEKNLNLLDELIKSRFVEMFGDVFNGKSNYSTIKISDVVSHKIERASKDFLAEDEIQYVDISSIDNSKNNIIGYTNYIKKDAPSRAQQHVKMDDIVISTVRPNLNNVARIQDDYKNIVASSGFCVLRAEKVESDYLFGLVSMQAFANYLASLTTGASYPAVSDKDILNFEIPNAPKNKQIEYAEFIRRIDKSKFVVQQQIKDLQELLDKKMDEYFSE